MDHNDFVKCLRQTSKGQIQYERMLNEKTLDRCCLLQISSLHTEKSSLFKTGAVVTRLDRRLDSGHVKQSGGIHVDLCDISSQLSDEESIENGERDSFEKEHSLPNCVLDGGTGPRNTSPLLDFVGVPDFIPVSHRYLEQLFQTSFDQNNSRTSLEYPELIADVGRQHMARFANQQRAIFLLEMQSANKAMEARRRKELEVARHQESIDGTVSRMLTLLEERHFCDMHIQRDVIKLRHSTVQADVPMTVQRLKQTHRQCFQRQDDRMREVEWLEQQLQAERIRRKQLWDAELSELRVMTDSISVTKSEFLEKRDSFVVEDCHLGDVNNALKLVSRLLQEADPTLGETGQLSTLENIRTELMTFMELFHVAGVSTPVFTHMCASILVCSRLASTCTAKSKPGQMSEEQSDHGALESSCFQGELLLTVAKEYEQFSVLLAQINASLADFIGDKSLKKVRFDLQSVVNISVNNISSVSSNHLFGSYQRLSRLLRGEVVEVHGKRVTANVVPLGINFCKNVAARMIVRKAVEQVSTNYDTAFSIAAVTVALWAEFPDIGHLFMAHFTAICPFVLPFSPPQLAGESSQHLYKRLGYHVDEDGTVEPQNKFLRRMSGVMRLYAAVMITAPPPSGTAKLGQHPHGLEHAWLWLSRCMKSPPLPDITAAAILDVLEVCGHFLLIAYRVQFVKLLYCLYKEYLPKMREVAIASGPVSRLQNFLENALKNNARIAVPHGYLFPSFWNT